MTQGRFVGMICKHIRRPLYLRELRIALSLMGKGVLALIANSSRKWIVHTVKPLEPAKSTRAGCKLKSKGNSKQKTNVCLHF